MTPRYALLGLAAVLAILASTVVGVDSCRKGQGATGEVQAHIADGEARTHAQAAQAIPDHAIQIQSASKDVDRARNKVARVGRNMAPKPGIPVPAHDGPSETVPASVDSDTGSQALLDALNAERELTAAQDAKIKVLEAALDDEKKRSAEWKASAEDRERQALAQEAATRAWKSAVTTSRWTGRLEGFAAGVALGYVGGRR